MNQKNWQSYLFTTCLLMLVVFRLSAQGTPGSLVFVEGYDEAEERISLAVGVIVKKNFVAVNYHAVAGMHSVGVFTEGSPKKIKSEGYLSVAENKDLIIISAPGIEGKIATMKALSFPEDGTDLSIFSNPTERSFQRVQARVSGTKELLEMDLPQLLSQYTEDCTSGPILKEGSLVGFITAGYLDDVYYAYAMPAYQLKRLMNRSFIIKSFNSLADTMPIKTSYFQKNLMENLTSVLWLPMPDAERLAMKKGKMILIDVSTKWSGWSKLMAKNTYSQKKIIRYINENFYAVKFNAESEKEIVFNQLTYQSGSAGNFHTLAYSLLQGKMDFPSTIFLDEGLTVIMVIPGYMDTRKMEVVLHYFNEKAYQNNGPTFQEYENNFLINNIHR